METKSQNIFWHHGHLTEEQRQERLGQKGVVLWFTGLSGSGKSTLAREVEVAFIEQGKHAFVLDGDNLRFGLNKDLGFSPEDRKENIRRISEVAKLFADAHVVVLTAFISPYKADRDFARSLLGSGRFFEIFCDPSLEACEKRDPKGLYKKARANEIQEFTGISAPYEKPENPEMRIETDRESIQESVQRVVSYLKKQGVF